MKMKPIKKDNKYVKNAGKKKSKKDRKNIKKNEVKFLYILVLFVIAASIVITLISQSYDQPEPITDPQTQSTSENVTTDNSKPDETTLGDETTATVSQTTE